MAIEQCTLRRACRIMRAAGGYYAGRKRAENLRVTKEDLEAWRNDQGSSVASTGAARTSGLGTRSRGAALRLARTTPRPLTAGELSGTALPPIPFTQPRQPRRSAGGAKR